MSPKPQRSHICFSTFTGQECPHGWRCWFAHSHHDLEPEVCTAEHCSTENCICFHPQHETIESYFDRLLAHDKERWENRGRAKKDEATLLLDFHAQQRRIKGKSAGIILIDAENRVLMIKGTRCGKWSFPKGGQEEGETLFECACRELYEESGVELDSITDRFLCSYTRTLEFRSGDVTDYTYFIFLTTRQNIKTRILDFNEVSRIDWVNIDKISELERPNWSVDIFSQSVDTVKFLLWMATLSSLTDEVN